MLKLSQGAEGSNNAGKIVAYALLAVVVGPTVGQSRNDGTTHQKLGPQEQHPRDIAS